MQQSVGAAWCNGRRVHWASPLNRRVDGTFNPLPFMLRFPEAQDSWAHFALALEWFDAACFAAGTAGQIRSACEAEPGWRLNCHDYLGPTRWTDLATKLGGMRELRQLTAQQIRSAVLESVAVLVREREELQGMSLEPISGRPHEVGWLHVTPTRRTLVAIDANSGLRGARSLGLESEGGLRSLGRPDDHTLWVLPQLRAAGPIRLLRRVTAVGPDFAALARGLIDACHA